MAEIIVEHISKSYNSGKVVALQQLNLSVEKGTIFGLIGPDGAGKTSLFRILTTLLLPDSGEAYVCNRHIIKDYKSIRSMVGYMPGKFSLYQDLSVEENLQFFASVFGTSLEANYEIIKDIYLHIEPFKKRRAGNLSGGMKQKLALCCSLIHKPSVLFLDEPTTGVDAVSRKEFWSMLKRLQDSGITIMVSTPYMDEANLCDQIALIQEGKILSVDTPQNISNGFPKPLFSVSAREMLKLLTILKLHPNTESIYSFGDKHHIVLKNPDNILSLQTEMIDNGFQDFEIAPIQASVEDCFIRLMS